MSFIRKSSISVGLMAIMASACVQVTKIPASNLEAEPASELPQELLINLERDIRDVVRSLHKTNITTPVKKEDNKRRYKIQGQLVSTSKNLRDKFTGDYFDCSRISVQYAFNYQRTGYTAHDGLKQYANRDSYHREDQICVFQVSGKEHYQTGPVQKLSNNK